MNLEKLNSLKGSIQNPNSSKRRPVPAFLLPVSLLIAFIVIFVLMFGSRLVPATEVLPQPLLLSGSAPKNDASEPGSSPRPSPTALRSSFSPQDG